MLRIATICWLMLAALPLRADTESAVPRSPGDMTVEERTQMMQIAGSYSNCLYQQGIENIDADADIRRIADIAMTACRVHLETLEKTITDWGFEPNFATAFTRNVRDRGVHKLLPELAIRKSN